jgi:hypothetical protein
MKDLKFICAQPDDAYYTWQVHLWIESLRQIGHSDKAIVLIYIPDFREKNTKWQQIIDLYPETEFVFYKDVNKISRYFGVYIPVLRPYVLGRYFKEHPEMKDKAVMYCDSDVLFTDKFDISKFIDDEVNYLSDTNSYINASYFDSKVKDVLPAKLEEYKTRDILAETTKIVGITREIAEKHNLHSGGAQYLLKNIDHTFWEKVLGDCIMIRTHLMSVNRQFFKDESAGFQSWCADMWAVLWNLWLREQETLNIPELEFSWSSDPIEKVHRLGILHNAGITERQMPGYPAFYKGVYHTGKDPFQDTHLDTVFSSEEARKKGTHYYVTKMIELKNKYNLNY